MALARLAYESVGKGRGCLFPTRIDRRTAGRSGYVATTVNPVIARAVTRMAGCHLCRVLTAYRRVVPDMDPGSDRESLAPL